MRSTFLLAGCSLLAATSAMPLVVNESTICMDPGVRCTTGPMDDRESQVLDNGYPTSAPTLNPAKYSRVMASQPGYQWNDAGGYCGSWAVQRAALAKGAWISQQQVRDHTSAGGGSDNEVLSTNIVEALTNLKIVFDGFDFVGEPLPQQASYFKWLKAQLVAGSAVVWMIMWSGESYPIYDLTPPSGMYGHVEPVIGIQSSHPLNDTTVYEDDFVMHYTDGGVSTVHRAFSTLAGDWAGEVGDKADCGAYSYCIGPYSFGWGIKGFVDGRSEESPAMPASLRIDPWQSEPDTRSGDKAEALKGTVTATELTTGAAYDIYRWDTVEEAFTYSDDFKKHSFVASSDSNVFVDDAPLQSDATVYYQVVPAA